MRLLLVYFSIVTFAVVVASFPTFEFFNEFEIGDGSADRSSIPDDYTDLTALELVANDEGCRAKGGTPGEFGDKLQARGRVCKIRKSPTSSDTGPSEENDLDDQLLPFIDISNLGQPDLPKNYNKCSPNSPIGVCTKDYWGFIYNKAPYVPSIDGAFWSECTWSCTISGNIAIKEIFVR